MDRVATYIKKTVLALGLLASGSAFASHSTGHTLWTTTGSDRCASCHGSTPSGTQRNGAGSTSNILTYVFPAMGCGYANGLDAGEKASIGLYIRSTLSTISYTTPANTARSVNVSSHITLPANGGVAFSAVTTHDPPTYGSLSSWGSDTIATYTPPSNWSGVDTFQYKGFRSGVNTDGNARTVTITVGGVPNITSSLTKTSTVGVNTVYTITATNYPETYSVSNAPTGVTRSGAVLSGIPTSATDRSTTIGATNDLGTDTEIVTWTVNKGNPSLSFAAQTIASRAYVPSGTFSVSPQAAFTPSLAETQLSATYTSSTPSVCTTPGTTSTTVTIQGAGTCTLTASFPGNVNWNPALTPAPRSVTITKASQTITFNAQATPARNFVSSGSTFAISPVATTTAAAQAGIAIVYGSSTPTVCSVSGTTVTMLTAGVCTITANEDGNNNYNAAAQKTSSVTINAIAPGAPTGVSGTAGDTTASLSFTAPANNGGSTITGYTATCGAKFQTTQTGNNTVSPVEVASLVNGVTYDCSVSANTTAFPTGGTPSSSVNVTPQNTPVPPSFTSANNTTFTVASPGNFSVTANGTPSPTITVSGTLPSGVTFSPGTGSRPLSGTPASGTAGNYPLVFTADGTNPDATQNFTLTIAKRSQSINFTDPTDVAFSATLVPLTASATSGLTVTFTSLTPAVCGVSGANATQVDAGDCTIQASQAGDADWNAASPTQQTFTISQGTQTIDFPAQTTTSRPIVPGGTFAASPPASASSTLPVTYSSSTPAVCTPAGGADFTMVAIGTCTMVASQDGDSRYLPADDAQRSVSIVMSGQTITFPAQADQPFSLGDTFAISPLAFSSSGLDVAYTSQSLSTCTIDGTAVTMLAVGACVIAADQPGDANYMPATQVTRNINIVPAAPGAPEIGTATPGNGQALIEFAPPESTGGSPITNYTATCTAAGQTTRTGDNTASPVTVTLLTNNVGYTCSVTATNAVGTGPASATVPVTPSSQGPALWSSICASCHGTTPAGARFNAAGTTTPVLDYVISANPEMNALLTITGLTPAERADLVAYITSYLGAINEATAPHPMAKAISVASHITLNTYSFTSVEVVTPPTNGTLSAFSGTNVVYTPNPGYTGPDSFTYRGKRTSPVLLLGDPRTVSINVTAGARVLTVAANGSGGGLVESISPTLGISCPPDCTEAYGNGVNVQLMAFPDDGAAFTGWGGACTGTGDCIVTMSQARNVTATFSLPQHVLTVTKPGAGAGLVTSAPVGINCGVTCSAGFDQGVQVTLSQAASPGSQFTGWGGSCTGTGSCIVTMDAAKGVSATFTPLFTLTVARSGAGAGTVTSAPAGIDCGVTCNADYLSGTPVQLTATPTAGSVFTGWSGACTGTGACNVSMSQARSVTADFAPAFLLTVAKAGSGSGTVSSNPAGISCGATCSASFNSGMMVALSQVAAGNSTFAGWSGGCTGTGGCVVTMDAAKGVTATFNLIPAGTPGISLDASSLDFGGQSMGTASPAQSITVTNTGTGPLTVTNLSLNSPQFTHGHNCTSIAPAATCTINVAFAPLVGGGALNSTVTVNGQLTVSSNAPTSPNQVTLAGLAEKSLVTHYYRSILRRAPDAPGAAFWTSEANRLAAIGANVNETWFAMSAFFYFSPEYVAFNRTPTEFVSDLYNTFFNRPPDAPGLDYWTGQISLGMPREVVLVSFMFSTEFVNFSQAIFGNTAARAEVDTVFDFYRGLLSRLPDQGGYDFWVQQFRTAQCQGAGAAGAVYTQVESISSGFANGGEYLGRGRTNGQYIGDLYNAFLRRGGDLGGVQFWIGQLDGATLTRDQVRQQFIASGEFTGRVNNIINQGCLP